jgi:hypothetical protein
MAESIDYYMSDDERSTVRDALRIAIAFAEAEYLKVDLVYDKEKMADWQRQVDRFLDLLQQLD